MHVGLMRIDVVSAVKMSMVFLWITRSCGLRGGLSDFRRNVLPASSALTMEAVWYPSTSLFYDQHLCYSAFGAVLLGFDVL
jgi:hypothetical protein